MQEFLRKNIHNVKQAFPEEIKIEKNLVFLLDALTKFSKEATLAGKATREKHNYQDLFEMKENQLINLIKESTLTSTNFRKKFFPNSIAEDEDDDFKESRMIWDKMWKLSRHAEPWKNPSTKESFSWLQKRGATREHS